MKKNNKNDLEHSKDNSNNNLLNDVSETIITLNILNPVDISNIVNENVISNEIINPLFENITPLKLLSPISYNKNDSNDINDSDASLNMGLNTLLSDNDGRKKNKRMRLKFLEDIKNGLDDKENKNTNLRESLNKKIDYESELLTFLNNITSNYDLLHDNKNEYLINDINSNIPPPPSIPPPPPPIIKRNVIIDKEISGIEDLLSLINDYPLKVDVQYNINMIALHNIKKPLLSLNNMIGMGKLKNSVVDQIIYFMQGLDNKNDFMHTVIYGPPGTGKTEIAEILGNIYSSLGVLKRNVFKKVTRSDLIAGYLGQTAIKTREVIEGCLGGVLFIDEAYALGNDEKRDSFAKECIDTLCESLSAYKNSLMVIIAGYEEDLNKCFFSYNQGLNSRFPWRFNTNDYTSKELNDIFNKKVKDIAWSIKEPISDEWFENKRGYFKYYGRDIEVLLAKIKIVHGRRVFCKPKNEKTVITQEDLDNGFNLFIDNKEVQSRVIKVDTSFMQKNMYL
jgi:AAA+ superfamily predicted ATPase